jgi:hypothetical protein
MIAEYFTSHYFSPVRKIASLAMTPFEKDEKKR